MCNDAGLASLADVFQKEVIIGVGGGATHDMPRALVNVLGGKLRLVAGCPGTRDVMLAIDKNEVQGICGQGIANISWQRPDWFQSGSPVKVIVQEAIHGELRQDAGAMRKAFAQVLIDEDFLAEAENQKFIVSLMCGFLRCRPGIPI